MKQLIYAFMFFVTTSHLAMEQKRIVTISADALDSMKKSHISLSDIMNTIRFGTCNKDNNEVYTIANKRKAVTVHVSNATVHDVERTPAKKKTQKKYQNKSYDGRKIISFLTILEPSTPLEKSIESSIEKNDIPTLARLLDLGAPYTPANKTLPRCFMAAVRMNNYHAAALILARVTSKKQIATILRDDYLRHLDFAHPFHALLSQHITMMYVRDILKNK